MKKTTSRFLLGFLLAGLLISPNSLSSAVPKTYSSCSALNKVYSGGIAQKAGYKNVGGVLAVMPKVSGPLYLSNKKLDKDKDGIVCEVLRKVVALPTTAPTPEPQPELNLDNLDSKFTSLVAQKFVAQAMSNSPTVPESILAIQSGPSLSQNDLVGVKMSLMATVRTFQTAFLPDKVHVNWFTFADADWVDDAIRNSGGNPNATATGENFSAVVKRGPCNMGTAGFGLKGPYINQCLRGASATHDTETAAHEYFHTVQTITGTYSSRPHWFTEGSATFVGIHVGGNSVGDFKATRERTVARWTSGLETGLRNAVRTGDTKVIVERFRELQASKPPQAIQTSGYALGMFLTEALVAAHGFDHWIAYLQTIKALGLPQATEKAYGLTLDELYSKVAPYAISQLKGN
jgi:hypothetical protein